MWPPFGEGRAAGIGQASDQQGLIAGRRLIRDQDRDRCSDGQTRALRAGLEAWGWRQFL